MYILHIFILMFLPIFLERSHICKCHQSLFHKDGCMQVSKKKYILWKIITTHAPPKKKRIRMQVSQTHTIRNSIIVLFNNNKK
jgi:hypothetical protein